MQLAPELKARLPRPTARWETPPPKSVTTALADLDNTVTVTDLSSTNGTYIDDKELPPMKAVRVREGAVGSRLHRYGQNCGWQEAKALVVCPADALRMLAPCAGAPDRGSGGDFWRQVAS